MHFIGDFFLRNKFLDVYKSKSISVLSIHCFVWAGCISIGLEYFGGFTLGKFWFLFLGHFAIDYLKGKHDPHPGWDRESKPDISKFKIIDQAFHMFQLILVWGWR